MSVTQQWEEFKWFFVKWGFSPQRGLGTRRLWRQNDRSSLWSQPETAENHSEITRWLQVILCIGMGIFWLSFLGLVKDLSSELPILQHWQRKLWQIRWDLQRKKCCASTAREIKKVSSWTHKCFWSFSGSYSLPQLEKRRTLLVWVRMPKCPCKDTHMCVWAVWCQEKISVGPQARPVCPVLRLESVNSTEMKFYSSWVII